MTTWRDQIGQWVGIVLLATIAAASWLVSVLIVSQSPATSLREAGDVTAVITSASIVRTGLGGAPEQLVTSARIEQYRDGRATLDQPKVVQSREDQAKVEAIGRFAEVSSDQNVVRFKGNVLLEQSEYKGAAPLIVRTETLEYRVDEGVARTLDPVIVQRGSSELHGVGLIANHKTGRLQILADSRMVIPRGREKSSELDK